MNAVEIEEAVSDLAAQPFDRAEFPYAFLAAFGNKDTTIKRLRAGNTNASDIPGGVLQRNHIHMAVCDDGQVSRTLVALRESPKTKAAKARFVLATDGVSLEAEDLQSSETIACAYPDFAERFGFSCRWRVSRQSRKSRTTPSTCGRRGGSTSFMSSC